MSETDINQHITQRGSEGMSPPMLEAWHRATSYDATLRADDPRFRGALHILHEEGTTYFFMWAFCLTFSDYYLVFTEHHGCHIFPKHEVEVHVLDIPMWQEPQALV